MNYFNNCVNWDQNDVDEGLIPMIDSAISITRRTFLKHVDKVELKNIEHQLGYSKCDGLYMCNDWAVSYHRSKLHNERIYYFRHSAIEYVFN